MDFRVRMRLRRPLQFREFSTVVMSFLYIPVFPAPLTPGEREWKTDAKTDARQQIPLNLQIYRTTLEEDMPVENLDRLNANQKAENEMAYDDELGLLNYLKREIQSTSYSEDNFDDKVDAFALRFLNTTEGITHALHWLQKTSDARRERKRMLQRRCDMVRKNFFEIAKRSNDFLYRAL